MPDASGHLSPAEISFITKWITDHHNGTPYRCPICDSIIWLVGEYVIQSIVFPIQGPNVGNSVAPLPYPSVRSICVNCGYEIRFNAPLMGLYPKDPSSRRE
jgi:hypothetical protein